MLTLWLLTYCGDDPAQVTCECCSGKHLLDICMSKESRFDSIVLCSM